MKYFYKIRNVKTGLYKDAGIADTWASSSGWSKNGKVWKNIAALMGHFALYTANRKRLLTGVEDWQIEMYSTEMVATQNAADFLKERWEMK